jgi:hypothetical protein
MGFAVDGNFLRATEARVEAVVRGEHKRCSRCSGGGLYGHHGQCFRCGGSGIDPKCPCLTRKEDRSGYYHPTPRALYRRMVKSVKWILGVA